uniref:Chemokine interleukin-8-like domain-containing protein n=1 Tax=Xiphophorus couchianus TaxID=32473 RepID=A0A3B5LS28_9TELE
MVEYLLKDIHQVKQHFAADNFSLIQNIMLIFDLSPPAQHVVGIRCKCPVFSKILRSNFTDFQVTEARAGCDRVELTVTRIKLDNSTETLCLNPKRRTGLQILTCWEK